MAAASSSFASGQIATSFSFGPENYIESHSTLYLDLSDHLGINAEATFNDENRSKATEEYLLQALLSMNKNVTIGGGFYISPPSNELKSDAVFCSLDLTLFRSGANKYGDSNYKTTVGVSGEIKRISVKASIPFNQTAVWYSIDQNSAGLSLSQTLFTDYYIEAGFTNYSYDRDLNAIKREILRRLVNRDFTILRFINALRYASGLPSGTYSISTGAQFHKRLHLDLAYSRIKFELDQPDAGSYLIGADIRILENIDLNLEYNLYNYEASDDVYFTGGITYYFN